MKKLSNQIINKSNEHLPSEYILCSIVCTYMNIIKEKYTTYIYEVYNITSVITDQKIKI